MFHPAHRGAAAAAAAAASTRLREAFRPHGARGVNERDEGHAARPTQRVRDAEHVSVLDTRLAAQQHSRTVPSGATRPTACELRLLPLARCGGGCIHSTDRAALARMERKIKKLQMT